MKIPALLTTTWVWVELHSDSFHALTAQGGVDLPCERAPGEQLTPGSVEAIRAALSELLGRRDWRARVKIVCALNARGLVYRQVTLPAAPAPEIPKLLQLQIENEFPLPPESLAWGWQLAPTAEGAPRAAGRQEVWVAAVRREALTELTELLQPLGAEILFTPAAPLRASLGRANSPTRSVLEIGDRISELSIWDAGQAPRLQTIPWGTARLEALLNAENPAPDSSATPSLSNRLNAAARDSDAGSLLDTAIQELSAQLQSKAGARPILISSRHGIADAVAARLGADRPSIPTEAVHFEATAGATAATAALKRAFLRSPGEWPKSVLELRTSLPAEGPQRFSSKLPSRPIALALALFLGLLAFPYLEAVVAKPRLAHRLAELKTGNADLLVIDRELSFLRYLEEHQSPHLDATYVIAQAAPPGTRIETLNLNRQGEVSMTGFLRDLAQVGDFRLKLINSGFFSTVVVEDQSPTPDRQRINFRITARWKDSADREGLSLGPTLPEAKPTRPGSSNSPAGAVAPKPLPAP